jgi:hypothetical protein
MATINSTNTTAGSYNYVNETFMRTGMRVCRYTDRIAGTNARGALLSRLGGSGVLKQAATLTNPFLTRTS